MLIQGAMEWSSKLSILKFHGSRDSHNCGLLLSQKHVAGPKCGLSNELQRRDFDYE